MQLSPVDASVNWASVLYMLIQLPACAIGVAVQTSHVFNNHQSAIRLVGFVGCEPPWPWAMANMVSSSGQLYSAVSLLVINRVAGAANAELVAPNHGRKLLQGNTTDAALRLCVAPGFTTQQCALADDEEEAATTSCLHCGSQYRFLPDPPAELGGHDSYYQIGVKILSLTCKGHVLVRSVFKMHEGGNISYAGTNCTNAGMDRDAIRCELHLPATGGSEVDRALKAKEVKCWQCGRCSEGKGCPNQYGVWYSDTYTTVAQGCDFTPKDRYEAQQVGFVINPKTKVLLVKFEACNNPGCFNATYEAAKNMTAKPCVGGTCAE